MYSQEQRLILDEKFSTSLSYLSENCENGRQLFLKFLAATIS